MKNNTGGQALLLVVLGMAIVLTIVLSIVASTTTDIKTTTNESESLRAFSAAEAGVEKSLIGTPTGSGSFGTNSQYTTTSTTLGANNGQYVYPQDINSLDTATVWFVSHDADNNLICDANNPCFTGKTMQICWGRPSARIGDNTPAIEVSILYVTTPGDYSTARIARIALDPFSGRLPANQFTQNGIVLTGCNISGQDFAFSKTLDFSLLTDFNPVIPATSYGVANGLQMAVVRMIYNTDVGQPFGVNVNFAGNSSLPIQATKIESTGTAGGSTRKIQVLRTFPDLPPVFNSVLFAPGGITQ